MNPNLVYARRAKAKAAEEKEAERRRRKEERKEREEVFHLHHAPIIRFASHSVQIMSYLKGTQ